MVVEKVLHENVLERLIDYVDLLIENILMNNLRKLIGFVQLEILKKEMMILEEKNINGDVYELLKDQVMIHVNLITIKLLDVEMKMEILMKLNQLEIYVIMKDL